MFNPLHTHSGDFITIYITLYKVEQPGGGGSTD